VISIKDNFTVTIISPNPVVAVGISSILKETVSGARMFSSAIDFLNWFEGKDSQTDFVVVDSNVGVSIAEMLIWEVSQKRPGTKMLLLASESDIFSSRSFLYSGVWGILNRDAEKNEVLCAFRKIENNEHYFSPGIQYRLLQGILSRQKYLETLRRDYNLSEKELLIIRLICAQKKSKDISDVLSLSQRTIEGMRARILRKLGLENGIGLILFGLRHNLIDENGIKSSIPVNAVAV
jgi:DNA-binding NarL/FixJ family response regulator